MHLTNQSTDIMHEKIHTENNDCWLAKNKKNTLPINSIHYSKLIFIQSFITILKSVCN